MKREQLIVKDKCLIHYYNQWRVSWRKFGAIALGRMLIFRGKDPNTLKGWWYLLKHAKSYEDKDYKARSSFLKNFKFEDYDHYLESELWAAIRHEVLKRDRYKCRKCYDAATQVHHRSYDVATLCGANFDKLFSLCRKCHHEIEFKDGKKRGFDEVCDITNETCFNNLDKLNKKRKSKIQKPTPKSFKQTFKVGAGFTEDLKDTNDCPF